jgi:phosphatidylserine/phosphatidylglycerophosphate/cardiolipin synthase-like enzyme
MVLIARTRVAVSEFPKGQTTEFPPQYRRRLVDAKVKQQQNEQTFSVPMLSMGRYGSLLRYYRPADDAFIAMFDSAKTFIRLALQDLGPVCIPQTKISLPGCIWPKEYLSVFAKAIMRGVDVEIMLSNPNSIPGGLTATEANYGNGWSCVDVAAEIVKAIQKEFPSTKDETLRAKVQNNLRVCFIRRSPMRKQKYSTDMTIGLHTKHFIIDDRTCYIGSQNLYICDLAEWGVVIDHEKSVRKIMKECWTPLWQTSYAGTDVDVQAVMDGLKINRDGEAVYSFPGYDNAWKHHQDAALRQMGGRSSNRHIFGNSTSAQNQD